MNVIIGSVIITETDGRPFQQLCRVDRPDLFNESLDENFERARLRERKLY